MNSQNGNQWKNQRLQREVHITTAKPKTLIQQSRLHAQKLACIHGITYPLPMKSILQIKNYTEVLKMSWYN